ncbi:glycosyl transferase [Owenweeksia hongkongensis DSM 17368]|uniref:Glycosyl transferase n=1 Tax=Owenweeksia hongkongensis (strain DSM 17368 / CIP 108786 / JCM 12287 / NRRL B-23963 / UST20020801) TaxID=926562 RepID=G8R506_OWEHD|nr:glycosyltransferase [Owenweeksia hongkongensis]AEV34320.1 glycosyl transferase [Owenweeksia hongkongensis DSM 17368]
MPFLTLIIYFALTYLSFSVAYYFIFSFGSIFSKRKPSKKKSNQFKYAILIPGYKEDSVIYDVAKSTLNQNYDSALYEVIIIADSFQATTLKALKKLPITVVEVSFEKSTKTKALNRAMSEIGDDYDIALVLDADNIMETNFINKINQAFNSGFIAVQGRRVAKNLNTNFAVLDAISEEIGHNVFKKGPRFFGFSSALAGSGMAFDYAYFKKIMKDVHAIGGFDKELEVRILKDQNKIEYLPNAIVYDEKVQKAEAFYNQRRRWLSSQSNYLTKASRIAVKELLTKGNFDLFNKVIQWAIPPKLILLALVLISSSLVFLFSQNPILNRLMLTNLLGTFAFFLLSIPLKFYSITTLKAVMSIPYAFWLLSLALFKIKGANERFIHTPHGEEN